MLLALKIHWFLCGGLFSCKTIGEARHGPWKSREKWGWFLVESRSSRGEADSQCVDQERGILGASQCDFNHDRFCGPQPTSSPTWLMQKVPVLGCMLQVLICSIYYLLKFYPCYSWCDLRWVGHLTALILAMQMGTHFCKYYTMMLLEKCCTPSNPWSTLEAFNLEPRVILPPPNLYEMCGLRQNCNLSLSFSPNKPSSINKDKTQWCGEGKVHGLNDKHYTPLLA